MLIPATSSKLRAAVQEMAAKWRGEDWEEVELGGIVPLVDGGWSTMDGGRIWRRWNGRDFDYHQDPVASDPLDRPSPDMADRRADAPGAAAKRPSEDRFRHDVRVALETLFSAASIGRRIVIRWARRAVAVGSASIRRDLRPLVSRGRGTAVRAMRSLRSRLHPLNGDAAFRASAHTEEKGVAEPVDFLSEAVAEANLRLSEIASAIRGRDATVANDREIGRTPSKRQNGRPL